MDEILTTQIKAAQSEIKELISDTRKAEQAFRVSANDETRQAWQACLERQAVAHAYLRGLLAGQRACQRLIDRRTFQAV